MIFQVKIFFEALGGEILVLRYVNKSIESNIPVRFAGNQTYAILTSNLHNGKIQTVLKGLIEKDKFVSFVDIGKEKNSTAVISIGNSDLSDVLLRDEDTVVAVKADDNKIFRSNISLDDSEPAWELIARNPSKKIIKIWINGDEVQGHYSRYFSIPLFNIQKPTEKEPLSPEKKEPPSPEEKEIVPPEKEEPLLPEETETVSPDIKEPLSVELHSDIVVTPTTKIQEAILYHAFHYLGLCSVILLSIVVLILAAVIVHLLKKNRESALSSKHNPEEASPLKINSSLNKK